MNTETKKIISKNLKALRQSLGIDQVELARRAGMSVTQYNPYETGKKEPKASQVIRLAEALEVTPNDILLESDSF
jgi:transcriptional regulator with XRE-family HTH domain